MTSEPSPSESRRRGPGAGCVLLALLVCVGLSMFAYGLWQVWRTVSDFEERYLQQGYVLEQGQELTIEETIEVDTYIYARQELRINAGANASLALSSHEAFIDGVVTGDVAFLGGELTLEETGIIQGNLNVTMAQNVMIRGTVEGQITGTWTRIFGSTANTDEADPEIPPIPAGNASSAASRE